MLGPLLQRAMTGGLEVGVVSLQQLEETRGAARQLAEGRVDRPGQTVRLGCVCVGGVVNTSTAAIAFRIPVHKSNLQKKRG